MYRCQKCLYSSDCERTFKEHLRQYHFGYEVPDENVDYFIEEMFSNKNNQLAFSEDGKPALNPLSSLMNISDGTENGSLQPQQQQPPPPIPPFKKIPAPRNGNPASLAGSKRRISQTMPNNRVVTLTTKIEEVRDLHHAQQQQQQQQHATPPPPLKSLTLQPPFPVANSNHSLGVRVYNSGATRMQASSSAAVHRNNDLLLYSQALTPNSLENQHAHQLQQQQQHAHSQQQQQQLLQHTHNQMVSSPSSLAPPSSSSSSSLISSTPYHQQMQQLQSLSQIEHHLACIEAGANDPAIVAAVTAANVAELLNSTDESFMAAAAAVANHQQQRGINNQTGQSIQNQSLAAAQDLRMVESNGNPTNDQQQEFVQQQNTFVPFTNY